MLNTWNIDMPFMCIIHQTSYFVLEPAVTRYLFLIQSPTSSLFTSVSSQLGETEYQTNQLLLCCLSPDLRILDP